MEYTPEELQQVQKTEMEILEEVLRICKEHRIPYFVIEGTLLGTIRHNGFIPWDDDIDIGMVREDYQRFLQAAVSDLRNGFVLQHYTTDRRTPTYHAKIRKDGTIFMEQYARRLSIHQGIFIDIMPFDRIPEEEGERIRYRKKAWILKQLYIAKSVKEASIERDPEKRKKAAILRHMLHYCLLPVPKGYLYRKYDSWLQKYNETDSQTVSWAGQKRNENLYTDIFPTRDHEFENIRIRIPTNPDPILRRRYGDYITPPAPENRRTHSPYRLQLSTDEPGREKK